MPPSCSRRSSILRLGIGWTYFIFFDVAHFLFIMDAIILCTAPQVADMKNSVKDRSNAQCSCAGHFIENHIDSSYAGGWLHVDMAGPGSKAERGTGYGVGLVLSLVGAPGFDERS